MKSTSVTLSMENMDGAMHPRYKYLTHQFYHLKSEASIKLLFNYFQLITRIKT